MLRKPQYALAAALLLTGGIIWFASPNAQLIRPADAGQYEGQIVRVHGIVRSPWSYGEQFGYNIVLDGLGLQVRSDAPAAEGDWVEATGRLWRQGGTLTLQEDSRIATTLATQATTLATLADQPSAWLGVPVQVLANVEDDYLVDSGYAVRVGTGLHPEGAMQVMGALRYDAHCACHRFDIVSATPWIPYSS